MHDTALEREELPADDASFSRAGYFRMLDAALARGYRFVRYDEARDTEGEALLCLLRHDVDVDPGAAVEIARIESDLGVVATYFVMVRSPMYNAFGRANQTLLREIASLGHRIGLHYDLAFRPDERPAEEWIEREAAMLATMLGTQVDAVSFHQPMLSERDPRTVQPPGLASAFDFPGFVYVSDANKASPHGSFARLFSEAVIPRIHLCIHPIWWAADDPCASVEELWDRAIVANVGRSQEQILETERAFGSPRTFNVTQG